MEGGRFSAEVSSETASTVKSLISDLRRRAVEGCILWDIMLSGQQVIILQDSLKTALNMAPRSPQDGLQDDPKMNPKGFNMGPRRSQERNGRARALVRQWSRPSTAGWGTGQRQGVRAGRITDDTLLHVGTGGGRLWVDRAVATGAVLR